MIGVRLIEAALLLGLSVLLAGCYGILYGIAQLTHRRAIWLVALGCYAIQCAVVLAVIAFAPLTPDWKFVIAVFTLAFVGIPPVTWRFLERTH